MPIITNTKHAYLGWIKLAEAIWTAGLPDKHALVRHRLSFEAIAENAQTPASEIDFSESMISLEFKGVDFPDRKVMILLWRLSGKSEMNATINGEFVVSRVTPREVATAFLWLNEPKPRAKRARKAKAEAA